MALSNAIGVRVSMSLGSKVGYGTATGIMLTHLYSVRCESANGFLILPMVRKR
jgi:hypothetical protein